MLIKNEVIPSIKAVKIRFYPDDENIIWGQIKKKRELYNNIIACMRNIYADMQEFVLNKAGVEAQEIKAEIDRLTTEFKAAKAANNEALMRSIAELRCAQWLKLSTALKATRKEFASEIKQFTSKIGANSTCETYQLRCKAVDDGLGWGTANATLDAALKAWSDSMKQGKSPCFAADRDIDRDSLTIQFVAKGGLPIERILDGSCKDFLIGENVDPDSDRKSRREYRYMQFRLGSAKSDQYATGESPINYLLSEMEGASVPLVKLVRERKSYKFEYYIVITLSHEQQVEIIPSRKPLVALHFGWAADTDGRRIAGINDSVDPSTGDLLRLPNGFEETQARLEAQQAARDERLNEFIPVLKAMPETAIDEIDSELKALRLLPATHIAVRRLYRLYALYEKHGIKQGDKFTCWYKMDKYQWLNIVSMNKRIRANRKQSYIMKARELCKRYDAIVYEPLNLKDAGTKIDEITGEKSEFTRKARKGMRNAAIYEFVSVLKQQAIKFGVAVFEKKHETVKTCAYCGASAMQPQEQDWHTLVCSKCGAQVDRKINGATVLYQSMFVDIERETEMYHSEQLQKRNDALIKKAERLQKMQDARRAKRQAA